MEFEVPKIDLTLLYWRKIYKEINEQKLVIKLPLIQNNYLIVNFQSWQTSQKLKIILF